MDQINLSTPDRIRIDLLRLQLERWNDATYADVLVSCTEAARLLGKTPATVTRMLKEGRLRRTTIGNSTGIRLSEIREIKAQ